MNFHRKLIAACLLVFLFISPLAVADDLIMRRVALSFPEAMNALQTAIAGEGYRVSRVQRVDIGLTGSGYDTAEYRIVFFMRGNTLSEIAEQHPELTPFLPLKVTIFAEGSDTILVSMNPIKLAEFFPELNMSMTFARWTVDINRIFDRVQSE
jgi:uncharacterized protein (DUF302 family)